MARNRDGRRVLTAIGLVAIAIVSTGAVPQERQPDTLFETELDLVVREILENHPNPFLHRSREHWMADTASLRRSISDLSPSEFVVRVMQLVASLSDGHTRYDSENGSHGFAELFPIVVYPFTDALYVLAAVEEQAHLVGARIFRYGSVDADEAVRRVATTVSADNDFGRLRGVPYHLQRPAILHALDITAHCTALSLQLVTRDGVAREVELAPLSREDPRFELEALVFANDEAVDPSPSSLRRTPTRLHWLKHPQPPFWCFDVFESTGAIYAQVNRIRDERTQSFAAFCDELFRAFDEVGASRLILDVRYCPGGNNTLLRPFLHGIIRRDVLMERGHLFVITSRDTFSAAVNLVARIERETWEEGRSSVMIVGEPAAGAPNHFGDAEIFYHYRTDLTLMVSKYAWQDSVPWDRRRSIVPDLPAPLTAADYFENRDPALAAIESFIGDR